MELPSTAQPVPDAIDTWADINGDIYSIDTRCGHNNELYKCSQHHVLGYLYTSIKWKNGTRTTRAHRVIALTFIPNPDNLPIVMHINNKKDDNRVCNLKWGTLNENTQQAVDDGLLVNDKTWDDNQSIPVDMYDLLTNKLIASYGSARDAERETGYQLARILHSCKHFKEYTFYKNNEYFVFHDEQPVPHKVFITYDMEADKEIKRYANLKDITKDTGESHPSAYRRKPKWRKYNYYIMKKEI